MEVLKWIGYIVAAIIVLTVIVGAGLFVVSIVFVGGVALAIGGTVILVAGLIKSFAEQ